MTLEEYNKLYNEKVYRGTLTKADGTSAIIVQGMLQFDETACNWGGPYPGNFAYFCLQDHRNLPGETSILKRSDEHLQRFRFSQFGRFKEPAQSEEHLHKRLSELTVKQRKEWEHRVKNWKIDCPTLEKPFAFYMSGNDDCSYTKFYATLEEMNEELELFLSMQPLNIWLHVVENGFVFTN